MKQFFNLHTHTKRCGHAVGNDEEYIRVAIQAGFRCIGFSEHIQYRSDNGKYNRIDYEMFPEYFSDINKLKLKYKSEIQILVGIEAAYVPEAMEDLGGLYPYCDFVLLGQHQGGLTSRKYINRCNDSDVLQYAEDIVLGIDSGYYSIIAHPDFFMNARDCWSKECTICSEIVCKKAKENSIPLELNIKGAMRSKKFIDNTYIASYPNRKFWEIAEQFGNEVIYGWDAHSPEELLAGTEEVDKIIKGLNLNFISETEEIFEKCIKKGVCRHE